MLSNNASHLSKPFPMIGVTLRAAFAVGVALLTLAAGCGHSSQPGAAAASTGSEKLVLRIGYGKGGSFDIVRRQKTLEKRLAAQGITVQWLNFPMGPQMMEGIGSGNVDIGGAASTPPIFAQAAGVPFVYVANTPPGKSGAGAILVPQDSPVHTVADLKGKKIAFQPGSVWHYDLVKLLEQAGLTYNDVQPVKLAPADASTAFSSGQIDAWVQGEPYITLAQRKCKARILITTKDIGTTGGFTLAARSTVEKHPDWIRATLEESQKASDWAVAHPHDAALLTAEDYGLDVATVEGMIVRGGNTGFQPVSDRTVALQQDQADLFEKIGILPKHIDVRQTVLTPKEYAVLLPENARAVSAERP